MALRTTSKILDAAKEAADTPELKEKLVVGLLGLAAARHNPPPGWDRFTFRVVAIALGVVAALVVTFVFVLYLTDNKPDAALIAVGSAAVGALGGMFATPPRASGALDGSADPLGLNPARPAVKKAQKSPAKVAKVRRR